MNKIKNNIYTQDFGSLEFEKLKIDFFLIK